MRRRIIILVLAACWSVVVASPLRLGMARLGPVARAEGPTAAPAGQLPQNDRIPPEAVQRLGDRGPLPGVTAIAFAPDGKTLACGVGHAVWLWDMPTGKGPRVLQGHGSVVWSLAYAPDGKSLASAGDALRIWDATRVRDAW
jgi:WD40 repeat protein